MREVSPEVHFIGSTSLNRDGLESYLKASGCEEFLGKLDDVSGAEAITEVMGRLCYKSFLPGINPNVSKVREGNQLYIENILKNLHGSVIEHGSSTWILRNVSRIFTHELVRHRVGTAFSQESGRYVRKEEFEMWIPSIFGEDEEARDNFIEVASGMEKLYIGFEKWCEMHFVDKDGRGLNSTSNFGLKKEVTSAIRRLMPNGMANDIGFTANHRALRHIIGMRAVAGVAEEEIYLVTSQLAARAKEIWPNLYQDLELSESGGKFQYWKV